MRANAKLIISLVLIGLAVIFVAQNAAAVNIRFLFWGLSVSLALIIFFVLAIGIIVGWLLSSMVRYRRHHPEVP